MNNQEFSDAFVSTKGSFVGIEKVLPILTFFSGAAGLIYESLWMRSFGLIFGNTTHAITVILATYMGGIALGSYLVGRIKVKNPLKLYAYIELLIAITAIIAFMLLKLLPEFWGNFLRAVPLHDAWEVPLRIIFSGLVILLPTLCMGATVPLLVQILSRQQSHHKVLSRLYYMNTLGGAVGVLLTTYFLFPMLGLSKAYSIALALNFIIAGVCALIIFFKKIPVPIIAIVSVDKTLKSKSAEVSAIFILMASIVGATSFCLEILWSRSFALVIGSSIYSFNLMLFSFLLGLAVGTWLYEKYWEKIKNPHILLVWLLLLLGLGILISSIGIGWLPLFYYSLMIFLPLSFGVYQLVGFMLCFLVMVLLTSLFGFIFPLLLRLVNQQTNEPTEARQIISKLYAWNTLGTLVGALLTGFLIIPLFGLQKGYDFAAALPLLLSIIILGAFKKWNTLSRVGLTIIVIAGVTIVGVIWSPWNPLVITSGAYKYGLQQNKEERISAFDLYKSLKDNRKIIYYKEGIEGVVAVTISKGYGAFLSVNGKTDASVGDLVTQKLLAHVPLVLNANAKNALIIGWGSGCTSGTASMYPLESIETIEIEPAVYETKKLFGEINNKVYNDPRFHIIFKDGRNVLHTTPKLYDVIISEPSNPWITGVSNLFTQEFYKSGLTRLNKNGVFCQWFHMYDMPLEVIKSQVQTFCSVFPDAMLWVVPVSNLLEKNQAILPSDVLLIGSVNPIKIDMNRIQQLFNIPAIKQDFVSCGIDNPTSFVSNAILDRNALLRFSKNAFLNTDDFPYIEFNAPRGLFHNQSDLQQQLSVIYNAMQDADTAIIPECFNNQKTDSSNNVIEYSELYTFFGNQYVKKNLPRRAERAYKKAYQLNPNSFTNASSMAELYANWSQDELALSWCKKALQINRKDIHIWEILATVYFKLGNFEKLKEVYTSMMNEFVDNAQGSFSLGLIFYKEENYPEAEMYLNKALAINPNLQKARQLLESIKK